MQVLIRPWGAMHYRIDGPSEGASEGPAVLFANSLGSDLRLWDPLLAQMPGIRAIRFDKRGHGLSDLGGAVSVEDLAEDAAALIDHLGTGPVVVVGLSIGGMIAQVLAARRPDLVRAAVLSNSAVRMGTPESWNDRIAAIRAGGMGAVIDTVMERWFSPAFRARPELALWRNMVLRASPEGYIATCAALAAADLGAIAPTLRLPVCVIGGEHDGSSPPEQVRATAAMIPGARFQLIEGVGHLPCVEAPQAVAAILGGILRDLRA